MRCPFVGRGSRPGCHSPRWLRTPLQGVTSEVSDHKALVPRNATRRSTFLPGGDRAQMSAAQRGSYYTDNLDLISFDSWIWVVAWNPNSRQARLRRFQVFAGGLCSRSWRRHLLSISATRFLPISHGIFLVYLPELHHHPSVVGLNRDHSARGGKRFGLPANGDRETFRFSTRPFDELIGAMLPPDENQGSTLLASVIPLFGLALVVYVARIWTRLCPRFALTAADYTITVAMVSLPVQLFLYCIERQFC
jgi:hypothetical protein